MFTVTVIALMLAGIALGTLLFSRFKTPKPLKAVSIAQQAGTYVLLFTMGIWLGTNDAFWDQIQMIGLRGILFAAVTVACSVAAVWAVSRLFFRKGAK